MESVHAGPGFVLQEFRCRVPARAAGPEETAREHQICFVRAGLFERETRQGRAVADPNHVLFFNAGEPYRVHHPLPGGDDCLVLSLPVGDLLDLLSEQDPAAPERSTAPFAFTHAPCTAKAAVLQRRLLSLTRAGAGAIELQEVAFALAAEAVAAVPSSSPSAEAPRSPATRRQHREAAEAVKVFLAARLSDSPTLAEIARAVGYAPFHLARLFRREAGLPIHRYLIRLRMRVALERLAEDGEDLTRVALDLGFADHSHFTNAFRREFGVAPSRLRQSLSGRRLRRMRARFPAASSP